MRKPAVRTTFVTIVGASLLLLGGASAAFAADQPADASSPARGANDHRQAPDCLDVVKNGDGVAVVIPSDCAVSGAQPTGR